MRIWVSKRMAPISNDVPLKRTLFQDDFEPVDNCLSSVLGQTVELTDEFKANYERWLDKEVYGTQIEWDHLLQPGYQ